MVDLDKNFRQGSAARKVAELLLTGKAASRTELADAATVSYGRKARPVSVTTVNRVLEVLEREGCTIRRSVGDDGRQAVFQVVHQGKRKVAREFPPIGAKAQIVRIELVGEGVMIDFGVEATQVKRGGQLRFRGVLDGVKAPSLGEAMTVRSVVLEDEVAANVMLAGKDIEYVLRGVQNITPAQ